jgi:2-phosphosulfolactate phosphatase
LRINVTNLQDRREKISDTVVLVDVLRSSATIVMALKNGCKYIIPFKSIEMAKRAGRKLGPKAILVGEDYGLTPPGFDLNNSPSLVVKEKVKGKIICFRSSNLTRMLEKVRRLRRVKNILIGGLINAGALARYLKDISPQEVHIVICGNISRAFNLEDFIGAGCIVHRIKKAELTDTALAAMLAYKSPGSIDRIWQGSTARHAVKIGFERDIPLCIKESYVDIVPIYKDGRIISARER